MAFDAANRQDSVTVINCTWSPLNSDAAVDKHQDAARRALGYFNAQDYSGPKAMVMVDSSEAANEQMMAAAARQPNFYYFHLPARADIAPHIKAEFGEACEWIKQDAYFTSPEFQGMLRWVKAEVDADAKNPLNEGARPPLGSKRNFAIEVGKAHFAQLGKQSDTIVYFDDDVYMPSYVSNAVANLQNGNMFTAPMSYHVAYPVANPSAAHGFEVAHGTYTAGGSGDDYKWMDSSGAPIHVNGRPLSTKPFGFTYAMRTEAWKSAGGVPAILRGEDRSMLQGIIDERSESVVNLRTAIAPDLIRLLGDGNSNNAVDKETSADDCPDRMAEADNIYGVWGPFLAPKFGLATHADAPSSPLPQQDIGRPAMPLKLARN